MACPYFMPTARLENGTWPHPARLPLGAGWCGHCTAPSHEGEIPAQTILQACCNLGYASNCEWAPLERPLDAVRFAVLAPRDPVNFSRDGKTPAEGVLTIQYVGERNHRPIEFGELTFDLPQGPWVRHHEDARIQKMAECFLESYLQKRGCEQI